MSRMGGLNSRGPWAIISKDIISAELPMGKGGIDEAVGKLLHTGHAKSLFTSFCNFSNAFLLRDRIGGDV